MNPVPLLQSRAWTADHVRLAEACERARFRIRRLIPDAPLALREELGGIADALSHALKNRTARGSVPSGDSKR